MMHEEYETALALKKMEFIQQITSEKSLDTLNEWLKMYDEARFVASMNSDEEDLKKEYSEFKKAHHLV